MRIFSNKLKPYTQLRRISQHLQHGRWSPSMRNRMAPILQDLEAIERRRVATLAAQSQRRAENRPVVVN